jgi:hypothetical protein
LAGWVLQWEKSDGGQQWWNRDCRCPDGALLVVVIGGALLMMTGVIGNQNSSRVSIELPKINTPATK